MVALVTVAATFVGVIAVGGALGVAAARAQGAADASALAAAFEFRDLRALGGETDTAEAEPCAVAGAVAEVWVAVLTSCTVAIDGSVEVTVAVNVAGITVARRSRAGTS